MKKVIVGIVALVALVVVACGGAHGGPSKAKVCHKGKTLEVGAAAVGAHLRHGDTLGSCKPPSQPPGGGDTPVTPDTFKQVNRILACADKPVLRVADQTYGISVDLDLATFQSGLYTGVSFTVARWYAGVGATCDRLGGAPNGKTQDGYPVWVR